MHLHKKSFINLYTYIVYIHKSYAYMNTNLCNLTKKIQFHITFFYVKRFTSSLQKTIKLRVKCSKIS